MIKRHIMKLTTADIYLVSAEIYMKFIHSLKFIEKIKRKGKDGVISEKWAELCILHRL